MVLVARIAVGDYGSNNGFGYRESTFDRDWYPLEDEREKGKRGRPKKLQSSPKAKIVPPTPKRVEFVELGESIMSEEKI